MFNTLPENLKRLIWKHFYNIVLNEMKHKYFDNKKYNWDNGIYSNSGAMIFRNLKKWRGLNKNYSGFRENAKYIKYYWNYIDITYFFSNIYR